MDFRQYYDLETYLFNTVNQRFAKEGYLTAIDFFCIVLWKSERVKSKIADRLRSKGSPLEPAVRELTSSLAKAASSMERLRILMKCWGFRLPMATAVLTVLYPEEFTVYDRRVCDSLIGFHKLGNLKYSERLWKGYQDFKQKVRDATPDHLTLRDKDRYLWGKSWHEQLRKDIEQGFPPNPKPLSAPKPAKLIAKS